MIKRNYSDIPSSLGDYVIYERPNYRSTSFDFHYSFKVLNHLFTRAWSRRFSEGSTEKSTRSEQLLRYSYLKFTDQESLNNTPSSQWQVGFQLIAYKYQTRHTFNFQASKTFPFYRRQCMQELRGKVGKNLYEFWKEMSQYGYVI